MRLTQLLPTFALAVTPLTYAQHLDNHEALEDMTVTEDSNPSAPNQTTLREGVLADLTSRSSDTAKLLSTIPGLILQTGGGLSSLPSHHGLTDDRLRIKLDGMDLISACANHMNPPLSYIDPSQVSTAQVFAGLSPVSLGGDSIGSTVVVESAPASFSGNGSGWEHHATIGSFYRSNNDAVGVNVGASLANDTTALRYSGATTTANNYHAGDDFKAAGPAATNMQMDSRPSYGWLAADEVGSSYYTSQNHALDFAHRGSKALLEFSAGVQNTNKQGFPNQRMDMTANDSEQFRLAYDREFDLGSLQAHVYNEHTRHKMQFGEDKLYWYGPNGNVAGMPMDTEGNNTGLQLKGMRTIRNGDTLTVGTEYQRYRLDDYWAAVDNSPMMSPNTFWNIRDGQRDRYALYAEWESQWSQAWLTQIGVRHETVTMNSAEVQGYNPMMYGAAADRFNSSDRDFSDSNLDLTAVMRLVPGPHSRYELGYAIKNRSPSLYERYTWSTVTMAMNMNNWYGDGNGYVGNVALDPETAHTVSLTANWHDANNTQWNVQFASYLTVVEDYIDAVPCESVGKSCAERTDGYVNLSLDNQRARIYGADLSGRVHLLHSDTVGHLEARASMSYLRGENRTTDDNLYHMMPLFAKLTIYHELGAWSNTLALDLVDNKDDTQAIRKETSTAGYGLLSASTAYQWKQLRVNLSIDNLLDRYYEHPLGGAYLGQGATMGATLAHGPNVPGMGRSMNLGLTLDF